MQNYDTTIGINYLWDPVASVTLAHATGASFVREIFTGAYRKAAA